MLLTNDNTDDKFDFERFVVWQTFVILQLWMINKDYGDDNDAIPT